MQSSLTSYAINIGAAVNNSTPTVLEWGVGIDSSAVSLATGAPNPPLKIALGIQSVGKASVIGDPFNPPIIEYNAKTPIIVNSDRYFHIILRVPVGVATTNQQVRGNVFVEGYFE